MFFYRSLRLLFTQLAAEVFTLDDTARALEAIVTRRNGRVVTDSVPVSITLRGEMTPHGAGVLALNSVQNGIVRIRPARKGYWRGWAVVTAGTLRDSVPLRSTGFLARFIHEPTTAMFPTVPLARTLADSVVRVWTRHIMDTMPRRNLFSDSVRFGIPLNEYPEHRQQLASENRLVVFMSMGGNVDPLVFGRAWGAQHDASDPRSTVGLLTRNIAIAENRAAIVATTVHELGHILGIGDHFVWTARSTAATRADGTTGRVLNLPNALADLRAAGSGLPAYLTGIPVSRDGGHLVDVVAANDIMADRAPITNVVTTASLLILRDLGYRIDLTGAVPAQGRANPTQGW